MEAPSPLGSHRRDEHDEFTLKEWNLKGRLTREYNTSSRRFSGSYIRSFREETNNRSFRSNITISSTASSPGYQLKDEIDPSTYSFTTALKALQARSGYLWECHSPEGFALNSKWQEAERYICNPLSGQFPMECLSSKSVSGRSLHNAIAGKITMSAPLVYSSRRFNNCPKPSLVVNDEKDQKTKSENELPLQEKEMEEGCKTRDMGTQSTPPDQSPCSISYGSSPLPPNKEESSTDEKPPSSNLNSMEEMEAMKTTKEEEKEEDTDKNKVQDQHQLNKKQNSVEKLCRCSWQSGCFLSWRCLWTRKWHRDKHKLGQVKKEIYPSTIHRDIISR